MTADQDYIPTQPSAPTIPRLWTWREEPLAAMRAHAERYHSRCIYVATTDKADEFPVKIGIASDPIRRCREQLMRIYCYFEPGSGGEHG